MRVLVALTLCLALASTAQGSSFLDSLKDSFSHIGDAFTQTFHQMGQQATDVGKQLLNQAAEQGKQILGQTAQSLLLGTMNALSATSAPATKRELSALTHQLQPYLDSIDAKSHELQGLFQAAMGSLEEVSHHITELSPSEIASKVDSVIASHSLLADHILHDLHSALTSHRRRSLSDTLSAVGNQIVSLFSTHIHAVNNILDNAGSLIKQESSTAAETMTQTLGQLTGSLAKQVAHMGVSGHTVINQGAQTLNALQQVLSGVMHQD
ncbi:uncharacterized protein LOC117342706 [Pecten maximus]|uniref:uncharacterized protein LOC117342706 n=1 Tax=Pecten maximus TaxID=6579 RepID=UPI001458CA3E|nr:uncharacterized protein LOC117342706 [Pecten maximus]